MPFRKRPPSPFRPSLFQSQAQSLLLSEESERRSKLRICCSNFLETDRGDEFRAVGFAFPSVFSTTRNVVLFGIKLPHGIPLSTTRSIKLTARKGRRL